MKSVHVPPPQSEDELIERASAVAGMTVGSLAAERSMHIPDEMRRAKGLAGHLLELALGADAGSKGEPDFVALGVELKTLPIHEGRPKESTFVSVVAIDTLADVDFEQSAVWQKLRRVLWMPIEANPRTPLRARRYGAPVLWSPSDDQRRTLRDDYERVATLVIQGRIDEVTGHLGAALQVRPKAAHGRIRERSPDGLDGAYRWTGPRGFYLRPSFTAEILERAF